MATQSPGKSINPSWHYVSAEAGTRGRGWLEAAALARSTGRGWKCLGFKVTGSLNEVVNQHFLTGFLVGLRTECIKCLGLREAPAARLPGPATGRLLI